MQECCAIFLWVSLKWTSTEEHVDMQLHQGAKFDHFDISNLIYNKFSHSPASYKLNGENIKVMLELYFKTHVEMEK